jgi:intracellular multiplication protein IcmL
MAEDAVTAVTLRNTFYRDGQRKVILVLLLSIIVNFMMISLLVYVVMHPPQPQYFATSIKGRVTPIYPVDQPNQSDPAVLQWANQAAIAAYTYDYVNYETQLLAASKYFTPDGWEQFLDALKSANNLNAVRTKKLSLSAVAAGAPTIIDRGELNGRYSWRLSMPLLLTYQSASELQQDSIVVTMLVVRTETTTFSNGIGIAQFIVGPPSP